MSNQILIELQGMKETLGTLISWFSQEIGEERVKQLLTILEEKNENTSQESTLTYMFSKEN